MQLKLEQVSVVRGERQLLRDVTLTLAPGELLALVGPNGAGKTTLLRALLGLAKATSGRVLLDHTEVSSLPARERAARIAWLPQHSAAAEELPALEVVSAARFRFDEPFGVSQREARSALERVGVGNVAERPLGKLSGGERQRVALAALLAQAAPILLVDEPANHLDPAQQIEVYRLLGELWRDGKSVVCVTHDVNLLRHLNDAARVRLAGIAAGRIAFECPLDAAELPEKLSALFNVHMRSVPLGSERVLLAERAP